MDGTLRLRPLFAVAACSLPLATAVSAEPCVGNYFETPAVCAPTLDECNSGACGARSGHCVCGRGCTRGLFGSSRGYRNGDGGWRQDDEHGVWFDDEHDTGPVGSSQKCKHGKLWPPYPRPRENGEWSTQYHAATYWPHPYNCWDRSWVKQISATQIANGWAQATTMYAYHFDPETHSLNPSGAMHLRWILEQCPPQYRTVYVQAGLSGTVSETRLASVQNEATLITGADGGPIQVRPVQLAGRPASEVDMIRRSELQTMPRPRVMVDSVGTGAGDGGSGNGGTGGGGGGYGSSPGGM